MEWVEVRTRTVASWAVVANGRSRSLLGSEAPSLEAHQKAEILRQAIDQVRVLSEQLLELLRSQLGRRNPTSHDLTHRTVSFTCSITCTTMFRVRLRSLASVGDTHRSELTDQAPGLLL